MKYFLFILFCIPFISLSDGDMNNTLEQSPKVGATAQADIEVTSIQTNVAAVSETNAVIASPLTDTSSESQQEPSPASEKEAVSVPNFTYLVHQDDMGGRGSAFLLEDTNGVWLVSNVHVFSGSTNLTIINVDGNSLDVPSRVEVAKDRDIIRFLTDQPKGLCLSSSCEFEETIHAYGDSGGAGVLTKLEGKAIALGPDRIEISADIIPGNSGGPVVNSQGEVVGVSSYLLRHKDLPDWIAEGTRFSDTRRMAIRLNSVEWVPADFIEFYKETVALKELEESLYTAIFITTVLSDDITHTMTLSTDQPEFQSWVKRHNRYAEKESENGMRNNIRRLTKILERIEENPTPGCEITVPFLKDKLQDMQDACEATRKQIEMLSD